MKYSFTVLGNPFPQLNIMFTHSKKKARKFIKSKAGHYEDWVDISEQSDATTSCFQDTETRQTYFMVWMRPNFDRSAEEDVEILAHEATHIKQDYFESFGEDKPAPEEEAYIVGAITKALVGQHFRWKKRKLKQQ